MQRSTLLARPVSLALIALGLGFSQAIRQEFPHTRGERCRLGNFGLQGFGVSLEICQQAFVGRINLLRKLGTNTISEQTVEAFEFPRARLQPSCRKRAPHKETVQQKGFGMQDIETLKQA